MLASNSVRRKGANSYKGREEDEIHIHDMHEHDQAAGLTAKKGAEEEHTQRVL